MTIIKGQCYNCNNLIEIEIQQTMIREKLKWYLSYNCKFCNASVQIDDVNLLPEDIRQKVFIEEGEWEILVDNFEKHKQSVIKCLRHLLDISTIDLYQKIKETKSKSGAIYNGTKFEVDWLYSCMLINGIESIVKQCKKAPEI
jgi:hypothetical protein